MISEKVQVLIASFFEMYEEIALHTSVLHADAFLGFKAEMLRQFCKTGCSSKFSSLHKEFRTCSYTVAAGSLPATWLPIPCLVWCNHWVLIIPLYISLVEKSELRPAEGVSSAEQNWACRSSIFHSLPEMPSRCKWPFPPAWLLTSWVAFVATWAGAVLWQQPELSTGCPAPLGWGAPLDPLVQLAKLTED